MLDLRLWSDNTLLLERQFPSSSAFPSLEHLQLSVHLNSGDGPTPHQRVLLPLSRLPRLRCLTTPSRLSVDGLLFLCTLPLIKLGLAGCSLDTAVGSISPVTVAGTWQDAEFPRDAASVYALSYTAVCNWALAGYADSVDASAGSLDGVVSQYALQRLHCGWNVGVQCRESLARIPSLRELLSRGTFRTLVRPNLSPLFTSLLQPLLPHLHTSHFDCFEPFWLSEQAMAVLVHSSAAFLTAYSAQLQVLTLDVSSTAITGRLLESVLQCSQQRSLNICCIVRRDHWWGVPG